jgi:hypothetical protein
MSARKKLRKLTIRELGPPDDDLFFSTHAWDTERGRFTEVADKLAFALVSLAYEEMDKLERDYSKMAKMAESHETKLAALANDDAPFSPTAERCRDEIEKALIQLDRYSKLAKEPVDYAELDRQSGFPR